MCRSIQDDQLKVNHSLIGGISEFVREDGERSKDSKKIEAYELFRVSCNDHSS